MYNQIAEMRLSVGCLEVCCLLLLNVKDTCGQMKPANAVAEIGGRTTLSCSDPSLYPNWIMSKDGTSTNQLVIAQGCIVNTNLQNHYDVEKTGGPFVCNLIVFNVTMDQAGVYWCTGSDRSNPPYTCILTILDSPQRITSDNTPDVMVGEDVVITCTLNYNGSVEPAPTLRPHFYWTDYTGNNASNVYNPPPSNNSVVSQLTVTAGREDIMPYTCHVYMQLIQTASPGYATNTPAVDSKAISNTTTVLYNASTPHIIVLVKSSGVACGIIFLTCNSSGNPEPMYNWYYWNETASVVTRSEEQILTSVEANKSYRCEAYNTIRNVNYRSSTNYNVSESDLRSHCGDNSPVTSSYLHLDRTTTIGLAAGLGGYGLLNIMATIVFLWYYNRKSKTATDGREIYTFRHKTRLNGRFPWLRSMLPCLNESRGNAGCLFLWLLLFILMSVLTGIIVFPILVAMANCSGERHDAKGDSNNGMSNVYQEDTIDRNAASKSGTDAHGHVEAPYDEIGTMHPGRRVVLEETTSSNNKDAKKVFYTKVNPNFNAEEGVERYSVSLPS